MSKLLIVPKPFSDESINGYLLRLTEENGYNTPSWIIEKCIEKRVYYFNIYDDGEFLKSLSSFTGINEDEIRNLSFTLCTDNRYRLINHQQVLNSLILKDKTKICPLCIKENNYLKLIWELKLFTVCPYHTCLLIDKCPKCNREIRWARNTVNLCKCGFDFRETDITYIEKDEIEVSLYIQKLIYFDTNKLRQDLVNPIFSLELSDLNELLFYFFKYPQLDEYPEMTKRAFNFSNYEIHNILNQTKKIFDNWPVNFFKLFDDINNDDQVNFKNWLNEIYLKVFKRHMNNITFLFDGVEMYIADRYEEYLNSNTAKYITKYQNFLTATEAAKYLKIHRNNIYTLVENGLLKAYEKNIGAMKITLIDKDDIEKYKKIKERYVFIKEVEKILGVTFRVVKELIDLSILRYCVVSHLNNLNVVDYRSIKELFININSKLIKKENITKLEDMILINTAISIGSSLDRNCTYGYFINLILTGKIIPHNKNNIENLKSLVFDKNEITKYFRKIYNQGKSADFYSVQDASKILNERVDTIRVWIKKGIIRSPTNENYGVQIPIQECPQPSCMTIYRSL